MRLWLDSCFKPGPLDWRGASPEKAQFRILSPIGNGLTAPTILAPCSPAMCHLPEVSWPGFLDFFCFYSSQLGLGLLN